MPSTQTSAPDMIADFGAPVVIRHLSRAYSSTTDTVTEDATDADRTVIAALLDFEENMIDGDTIKIGDMKCFMQPYDGTPHAGDQVTVNGAKYIIVEPGAVTRVEFRGELQFWTLHLRAN